MIKFYRPIGKPVICPKCGLKTIQDRATGEISHWPNSKCENAKS